MKHAWLILSGLALLFFILLILSDSPGFMRALDSFGQKREIPNSPHQWVDEPRLSEGSDPSTNPRLAALAKRMIQPWAIANEAVIRFSSEEAYRDFLKNYDRDKFGLLDQIDSLRSVKISWDKLSDLADLDNEDVAPNYLVQLPTPPTPDGSIQSDAVPFGNGVLNWLGIQGDNSLWGAGKLIAVIDTGIEVHPTFKAGGVTYQDLVSSEGLDPAGVNGHGTAVASVAAGAHPAAPGVAPAADLLSLRVADENGNSDSFTLAKGILAASDAGADVINISLGSSGDSSVVRDAVEYALANGSTIVSAAGNNGLDSLTYPAAYEGVISVGSVDAAGQHLEFSNTSDGLSLSAPGYGIPAAWPEEQLIEFTGTSASAPFVAGAIAAIMSWDPTISGDQAYNLLLDYSNEAGAPGADSNYGEGILNLGRVLDRKVEGIVDLAIASHHYAGDLENNGREVLQVVVENRGTQMSPGSTLTVGLPNGSREWIVPPLEPNEIFTKNVVVDTRLADLNGVLTYESEVQLPAGLVDIDDRNNQFASLYRSPTDSDE